MPAISDYMYMHCVVVSTPQKDGATFKGAMVIACCDNKPRGRNFVVIKCARAWWAGRLRIITRDFVSQYSVTSRLNEKLE
jgi:hypothetical protein